MSLDQLFPTYGELARNEIAHWLHHCASGTTRDSL